MERFDATIVYQDEIYPRLMEIKEIAESAGIPILVSVITHSDGEGMVTRSCLATGPVQRITPEQLASCRLLTTSYNNLDSELHSLINQIIGYEKKSTWEKIRGWFKK